MERKDLGITFRKGKLRFYDCDLHDLINKFPTPLYLYSEKALIQNAEEFQAAANSIGHDSLVCFALKANPNRSILKTLAKKGLGGDVVSKGELLQALEAGIPASKIVFSGVGKQLSEIELALQKNILSINIESLDELCSINDIAKKFGRTANVAFRLNPNVNAVTHKHISTGSGLHKFGMERDEIISAIRQKELWTHCRLVGLSVHIGSQLRDLTATEAALKAISELAQDIAMPLDFIDVGGGLGVSYQGEKVASTQDYMKAVAKSLTAKNFKRIIFEPGRKIAASSGLFVTKVIRTKSCLNSNFIIVDGGMNDFLRPSMYGAQHQIFPSKKSSNLKKYSIVGPVCETADCFARDLPFPELERDDFLVLAHAGAYGRSMASNYNLRSFPQEVLINEKGELLNVSPT